MRIYKRGKFYWFQFRGKRTSLRVTDHKAAELAARELQRIHADPTYVPAHETTLGAALKRFRNRQAERGRAEATLGMYDTHVGHVARVLGEHSLLASIGAKQVDRYISRRRGEGASASTVGKELSTLRGTLKLAARRGEYQRPLEQVMPDGYSVEYVPLDRHLTEPQITKLLGVLSPKRAAICAFIVATAADWRCVADARHEDFGPADILVRGTKNRLRWRHVPILPPLRQLVELARNHVPFEAWNNVRRDMAAACRRAGVPEVTPRDLRRSHSKLLRARGVEPQLIAPMMGHRDSRMVEIIYGKLAPEALGELVSQRTGTKPVQVPRRLRGTKRRGSSRKAGGA